MADASLATSLKSLPNLLDRLEHTLSSSERISNLRRSPYERTKVNTNIDYARKLLTRLENDLKVQGKSGKRADLEAKKAQLGKLQTSLDALSKGQDNAGNEGEDDEGSSADEEMQEIINRYAPAHGNTSSSIDTEYSQPILNTQTSREQTTAAAAAISSTLRSRRANQERAADTATTTGISSSSTSSSASLKPPQPPSITPFTPKHIPITTSASGPTTNEALLTHHTSEQEILTTSLLTLATRLKESTLSFSDTLASSNSTVDRAAAALDRNVEGMETAERRMGLLRRITEGRGWWGRLSLWAWVGALWVVLVLIMFVMPKLRF